MIFVANITKISTIFIILFEPANVTFYSILKDGSRLPILIIVIAVDQAHNEITAFVLDNSQRKQAERALQDAVEKYKLLFNSIDQGFGIIELIYDDEGKAINFRFIESNPTIEQHFGFGNLQDKFFIELFPDENTAFIENLASVALTGESKRYVHQSETLRRWYEVYAFRAGNQNNNMAAYHVYSVYSQQGRLDWMTIVVSGNNYAYYYSFRVNPHSCISSQQYG